MLVVIIIFFLFVKNIERVSLVGCLKEKQKTLLILAVHFFFLLDISNLVIISVQEKQTPSSTAVDTYIKKNKICKFRAFFLVRALQSNSIAGMLVRSFWDLGIRY